MKYDKGSHEKLSLNFSVFEFDCPCKNCKETIVHPDLVAKLQALRDSVATTVLITSGYRCESHQKELESLGYETVRNSQHLIGMAADVCVRNRTGKDLEILARKAGFQAVGVAKSWIHVDLRFDKDRRWKYSN